MHDHVACQAAARAPYSPSRGPGSGTCLGSSSAMRRCSSRCGGWLASLIGGHSSRDVHHATRFPAVDTTIRPLDSPAGLCQRNWRRYPGLPQPKSDALGSSLDSTEVARAIRVNDIYRWRDNPNRCYLRSAFFGVFRALRSRRVGDIVETLPPPNGIAKNTEDFERLGCGGPQPSIPTALYVVAA